MICTLFPANGAGDALKSGPYLTSHDRDVISVVPVSYRKNWQEPSGAKYDTLKYSSKKRLR